MPPEGATLTCENIQNRIPCPFIIFADFESILTPINEPAGEHTVKIQEHHPCSVGVKVLSCNPSFSLPYASFFWENAVKEFLDYLEELELKLLYEIDHPKPLEWSDDLQKNMKTRRLAIFAKNHLIQTNMTKSGTIAT